MLSLIILKIGDINSAPQNAQLKLLARANSISMPTELQRSTFTMEFEYFSLKQ